MDASFREIDGNPLPDRATAGSFAARDGKQIRYGVFGHTAQPPKGTVVLLHGRNECIEKCFETIRDLAARGFGVATFDWRGQGGSDRRLGDPCKGHVDSFVDYDRDLEPSWSRWCCPTAAPPHFALAHSTGALIALLAASLTARVRSPGWWSTARCSRSRACRVRRRACSASPRVLFNLGLGSIRGDRWAARDHRAHQVRQATC